MVINQEVCIGCGICTVYCPNDAISMVTDNDGKRKAQIDQEKCLECGNCIRTRVVRCPGKAFYELPEEQRSLSRRMRRFFSDPSTTHPLTGVPGRGTEEVKTNDVTGRVCRGELGVCLELGRPIVGTTAQDIEKVTKHLAKIGITLEPCNPLSELIADPATGEFKPEFMDAAFISAIVEFVIPFSRGPEILQACKEIANEIDTVFSLDMICCYDEDGTNPAVKLCEEEEIVMRPNAKINIGIGRPYRIEREAKEGVS